MATTTKVTKKKSGKLHSVAAAAGTIDRIHATGTPPTPTKAVGDLAQVSTGATGSETIIIGLMEWAIDWKRKAVDSTTTDTIGYEGRLASLASWTATAKFAYIDADTSQEIIRAGIVVLQTSSQKYNFFNLPSVGRDSWSGNGILTGIKYQSGSGKLFGMDITIEGDGPLTLIPQVATMVGTGLQPPVLAED